jgi:hypothetical protein
MNIRQKNTYLLVIILALFIQATVRSQEKEKTINERLGFYVSLISTSFIDPFFQGPGNEGEIPIRETKSSLGFNFNALFLTKRVGLAIGFTSWKKSQFSSFQIPDPKMTDAPPQIHRDTIEYKDPTYSVWFFDLQLHWIPSPYDVSIYGAVGLGASNETYIISGLSFPSTEQNGSKEVTKLTGNLGVGIQCFLFKHVTLFLEYRWIPGSTKNYYDFDRREGNANYYRFRESETNNWLGLLTFGVGIGV